MKRVRISLLSLLLVVSVLLTSAGSVSAKGFADSLATPGVSWVSGDKTFTVDPVEVVSLPGTTTLSNGMLVPSGFAILGEKQFEGVGIKVSGFDSGKLNACFPITAVTQGWSGKVGHWDGTKWELLSTTIATSKESTYSLACASLSHNGVYALIKWVSDPAKLTSNKGDCGFAILNTYGTEPDEYEGDYNGTYYTSVYGNWFIQSDTDLTGKSVTVSVLSSSPSDTFILGSVSGTLQFNGGNYYQFELDPTVEFTRYDSNDTITYLLDFGSCSQVITTTNYD